MPPLSERGGEHDIGDIIPLPCVQIAMLIWIRLFLLLQAEVAFQGLGGPLLRRAVNVEGEVWGSCRNIR